MTDNNRSVGARLASPGRGKPRPYAYAAALLSTGAAAIHFAVAPEHFQEWTPFGAFFIVVGVAQLALAAAILIVPSRRLFAVALVGTLAIIGLWVISRTAGLPGGPRPGQPEHVGIADVICTTMETLSALVFALLLVRVGATLASNGQGKPRPYRTALATAPWALLAVGLTALGVGSTGNPMPVAFSASPVVPGHASTSVADLTADMAPRPVRYFTLTAEARQIDGQTAWTYDGTVPGPELRVVQGDLLVVTLINHLPVSTTIHWHGVRVPNAADGVAGVTQDALPPRQSLTYEFVAADAGTYWYHSHQNTEEQLSHGLYGPLVVEPSPGHVAESRDYTVMFHNPQGGGRVAVNGVAGDLHLDARPGETVRIRLVNAVSPGMDGGPESPVLLGAPYRVAALDGHDLAGPQTLGPQRIPLGMGQRADLVFTMPESGSVRLVDSQLAGAVSPVQRRIASPGRLTDTVTLGDGPVPSVSDLAALPVFDLIRYGTPAADPVASHFDAAYSLVLDSQPGFRDGRVELLHTLNGGLSPYVPPITVHEGQVVRLHIVNQTAEYHPIHLHGHVYSVLARDGQPAQGSPVHLDSVMVGPHQAWDVAFLADNPGVWMLHCHVPIHATFGMSMTVNYAGVSTPFEMGSRSGNVPE